MTYNTDRRKPLRGRRHRADFLAASGGLCWWCGQPITGDDWHDEHKIAKELMPPGSDWNAMSNRGPIHRDPCHIAKTALDRKAISKSNRIRRSNGPVADRRKTPHPIRTRKTTWPSRKMQSKPFPKGVGAKLPSS